jgi:three-Cys-motif partner protein
MPEPNEIDPADGLVVSKVGPWAAEKHERLRKFIDASRGARARFLPPQGTGGASYIELYSGPGRSIIRDTTTFIDGSPLVAYKAAMDSGAPFTELHLGDLDPAYADAIERRIMALGGRVKVYPKSAEKAVDEIIRALNPYGLHFAFIDPFGLDLPFEIVEKLARVTRMDMLIHVSVQDFQRNLDEYSRKGGVLDGFAPGWRDKVDHRQANQAFRAALLEFWLGKIRALGTTPARGIELVSAPAGQRLYWLVFVSRHDLGQKLWDDVRNLRGQTSMDF